TTGHRSSLKGNNLVQLALTDDHAPRMLSEGWRQALNPDGKLKIFGDTWVLDIKPGIVKRMRHCVCLSSPLPLTDETRKPAERFLIEAKRFANLACCGLATIGDHIRRHRSTEFTVALVDVLNSLFPFIFRRKIEVDIRPFSTAFTYESFKEQFN